MTMAQHTSTVAAWLPLAVALSLPPAAAQPNAPPASDSDLKKSFAAEHEIGRRFQFDPAELPAPKSGPIVTDRSLILPYTGQALQVPKGFVATPYVTGLANPRRLLVLPNGDVLVVEQSVGYVTLLRDDGEGHVKWIDRQVEDLNKPYGIAWQGDHLLIADQDGIWQVPHMIGAVRPGRPVPVQRADAVPAEQRRPVPGAYGAELITGKGVFGIVQGHQNRDLKIDPASGALFVGVGSSGNLGVEPEPKATIQRFDADGSNQTTYAAGTRNATALAFQPETGQLWAVVQERDGLGDNLPSDYLIHVQQGGFYGWPYAYIGKHPQPGFANLAPEKVEATITPDLLFQAHSSLLDLAFYEGDQFPADYKGSLFVALKGSWNRSVPTGYKVVLVPFKDGRPVGYYENFATGFWASGEGRAEVWGRPAALAVAKDGSLLVADDTGGTIWRISYTGSH
jgi:glucose/arabinose dehydrogenase